ncbi:DUF1961 family protein [Rubellicoccus peritrichatus]|uniref:DUF1961 family protein n=1 Tax=Rubellicoccus peritrichatus TaxID=3080537 RepID=A0AAQ3LAY8_9BACT|nr:DUF1961 family protein [Puniceicoccus sp. CR14]WOO42794.1 DUF1961 family protein [Puniceicoccus sp. CR14]
MAVKSLVILILLSLTMTSIMHGQESYRKTYNDELKAQWDEVFFDQGNGDWTDKWFLDGLKGEVRNSPEGMHFSAGPDVEDASHAVLWTQESFAGNIKLEFDYTRTDTLNRFVSIVFLQATGTGEGPYDEDISAWSELREIPSMKTYFDNMHLLHVSFTAYSAKEECPVESSYIRARRYPRSLFGDSFDRMELKPDFLNTDLFHPDITYHVVFIKTEKELFMNVRNDEVDRIFRWDLTQVPNVSEGRIGFRNMNQRSGLFKNISVSRLNGDDSVSK